MLRDLALAAKAACSKEDQLSLVPLVLQLKELAEKSKKSGILFLENELSQITDPFLKMGLQLILDKTDPADMKDILDSDIYYNESNGRELLKKIILREGLRRIRNGDTPRDVLICTKIFLGKVDEDAWKN